MTIRRTRFEAARLYALRHAGYALAAGLGVVMLEPPATAQIIIGGSSSEERPPIVIDLSVLDAVATPGSPASDKPAVLAPARSLLPTPPLPLQKPAAQRETVETPTAPPAPQQGTAMVMPAVAVRPTAAPTEPDLPAVRAAEEPPMQLRPLLMAEQMPLTPPKPPPRPEPAELTAAPEPKPTESIAPAEPTEQAAVPPPVPKPAAPDRGPPTSTEPPPVVAAEPVPAPSEPPMPDVATQMPVAPESAPVPDTAPAPEAAPPAPADIQSAALPDERKAIDLLPEGNGFTIAFEPGAEEIPQPGGRLLEGLAQRMLANEELRLQVRAFAGGTPETASQARRLSLNRALAVRTYLIDKGVRGTRIDVRALGNTAPEGSQDRVDLQFSE